MQAANQLLARVMHGRYIVFDLPHEANDTLATAARNGDAIGLVHHRRGAVRWELSRDAHSTFARRSPHRLCSLQMRSVRRRSFGIPARAAGQLYPAARSVPTLWLADFALSLDDRRGRGAGRHLGGPGGSGSGPSVARLCPRLDIADAGLDRLSLHVASGCAHAAAA